MNKKIEIIFLLLYPLLAASLTLLFKTNFLISIFIFFSIPSIYFSLRKKESILPTILFSAVYSLITVLVVDHLAALDNDWYVPTIFPVRMFGTVPFEDIFLGFFFVYFVIIFYKYFFDQKERALINNRIKYAFLILVPLLLLYFSLITVKPDIITIPFFYLKGGIVVTLIPSILFLSIFPHYFLQFFKTAVFFFYVCSLYEITGVLLGYWSFAGTNYLGWVMLLNHKIPYEELLFFLIFANVSLLCFFTLFTDTHLKRA